MSGRAHLRPTIRGTGDDNRRPDRRRRQFAWHALVALQVAGLALSMLGAAACLFLIASMPSPT